MSRPVFDVWTWRSIRNDALLRYNTLNQSEPLRISLAVFFALGFVVWGTTLADDWIPVAGSDVSLPPALVSAVGTLGSVGVLLRELRRRSNQLRRLELELWAQDLPFVRPSTNPFSPTTWQDDDAVTTFRREQSSASATPRLVALYSRSASSESNVLPQALEMARVLRRRLVQANALVLVAAENDKDVDLEGWVPLQERRYSPFLGRADNSNARWTDFFALQDNHNDDFFWFVLNAKGRSVASGRRLETLRWMELLGTWLLPTDILVPDDSDHHHHDEDHNSNTNDMENELRAKQAAFYQALTTGDLQAMTQDIFVAEPLQQENRFLSEEVQEILAMGGRLDPWNVCLREGARPSGMTIGNVDVCVVDASKRAYTTCLEFPSGMESLLAVQRWIQCEGEWKLQLHQTIPWTPTTREGGTLLCDAQGCVALTAEATKS